MAAVEMTERGGGGNNTSDTSDTEQLNKAETDNVSQVPQGLNVPVLRVDAVESVPAEVDAVDGAAFSRSERPSFREMQLPGNYLLE